MRLLRTILALVILVIVAHIGLSYLGYGPGRGEIVAAIFSLGQLAETPGAILLSLLPFSEAQRMASEGSFYITALVAIGIYLVLYLLLGVGGRS